MTPTTEQIKAAIEIVKNLGKHSVSYGHYFLPEAQAAMQTAISCMEKQMAKKPIIKPYEPALCPSCGKELSDDLGDGYYKHCRGQLICDCGQKLDWESERDK